MVKAIRQHVSRWNKWKGETSYGQASQIFILLASLLLRFFYFIGQKCLENYSRICGIFLIALGFATLFIEWDATGLIFTIVLGLPLLFA